MSNRSTGIAFFDTNDTKSGGWCSLGGGRAKRFNGFTDLSALDIWITNLPYGDFNDQGMEKSAHLRNASFFRQSLLQIAGDCGFQQDSDIPSIVEALSGIASRVIEMSQLCMPGIRILRSLPDSIYSFLNLNDFADDPAASYQPQFQAAFQENSQVGGHSKSLLGTGLVRLSMNRVDFAEEVLNYPFPVGAWREERSMSVDEFINLDVPAIASVEVDQKTANKSELLAFGSQFTATAVMREFITQPEASMLHMAGAKVKIHHIIRGSASCDSFELPGLLTNDPLIRTSYSAGIVAENYLHALTSKQYIKGSKKNARTKYFFPSRAVYLKAVDRMLSYGLAKQMSDRNHIVSGYGFGGVSVMVTEDLFVEVVKDAADLGFAIVASKFRQK